MCAIDGITLNNAVLNIGISGVYKGYPGFIITHIQDMYYRLRGSVHVNKNNGNHNADDYYLSDFANTLNRLYNEIGLNPAITPLNGFEFGVNIKLPFNPSKFLSCIILHKSNSGYWTDEKRNYKIYRYNNYSIKFYNKTELTKDELYHSDNILRIEVRIIKMKHLKKTMTYTKLSDLLDPELWKQFEIILLEAIHDCLIIDFTEDEISQLTDKERIKYGDYINAEYWHNLYKVTRKNRKKYLREREKCDSFIFQHSNSTLKSDIINLVQNKCEELIDVTTANLIDRKWNKLPTLKNINDTQKWNKLPAFENEQKPNKWNKLPNFQDIQENENGNKLPSKIREELVPTNTTGTNNFKHCKSCGKILTNPSKYQIYCSAKVVGEKDSHKCRNKISNPKNNTQRSIRRILSIPLMFDLSETIAPNKRMYL